MREFLESAASAPHEPPFIVRRQRARKNFDAMSDRDDGGVSAMCPDLPGLLLAGDTQAEMLQDAREIVGEYILEVTKRGLEIAQPGEHFVKIVVPAA